ncbi:MAG: hypothetical protein IT386_01985 [Deltaproteobacteria bacterium]|nr:hypothetical protein [Deltaproteobacteria bacterium]
MLTGGCLLMRQVLVALAIVLAPGPVLADPPAPLTRGPRDATAGVAREESGEAALASVERALLAAARREDGSPAQALAQALARLGAATRIDSVCARIAGRFGTRIAEAARRAGSPDALDSVAACSARIGLTALANRLRAARMRDFGPPAEVTLEEADAAEIVGGPVRALAAYARGDFEAVRSMDGAGAWATLSSAAQTARRARAALDAPPRVAQ